MNCVQMSFPLPLISAAEEALLKTDGKEFEVEWRNLSAKFKLDDILELLESSVGAKPGVDNQKVVATHRQNTVSIQIRSLIDDAETDIILLAHADRLKASVNAMLVAVPDYDSPMKSDRNGSSLFASRHGAGVLVRVTDPIYFYGIFETMLTLDKFEELIFGNSTIELEHTEKRDSLKMELKKTESGRFATCKTKITDSMQIRPEETWSVPLWVWHAEFYRGLGLIFPAQSKLKAEH